jgi:hypothetical protein
MGLGFFTFVGSSRARLVHVRASFTCASFTCARHSRAPVIHVRVIHVRVIHVRVIHVRVIHVRAFRRDDRPVIAGNRLRARASRTSPSSRRASARASSRPRRVMR